MLHVHSSFINNGVQDVNWVVFPLESKKETISLKVTFLKQSLPKFQ